MKKKFYVKLELDFIVKADDEKQVRKELASAMQTMTEERFGIAEVTPFKIIEMKELGTIEDE
jgi:hypothetical protein